MVNIMTILETIQKQKIKEAKEQMLQILTNFT